MKRVWDIRQADPGRTQDISKEFSLDIPIAQLLLNRGLGENSEISSFLQPRLADLGDPFLLPDMDKAVERVLQAIAKREKIVVFGDYDVDGMTSIALLLQVLGAMGAQCGFFLPSRFSDGYGLKKESVARCAQEGARVLICVDCGTNSVEEIRFAKAQGVDVLVLDHHEHRGGGIEAVALVNPKRKDSRYHDPLSSVGICFKLAHALVKRLRNSGDRLLNSQKQAQGNHATGGGELSYLSPEFLKSTLDLVAVGTVADMVPLLGENRILVSAGLRQLALRKRPGLRILSDLSAIKDTPTATDVAFRIAPRLNANGRLSDAQEALALLCEQGEARAMALAQHLHQQNTRRQQIERQASQEAIAMVHAKRSIRENPVLVVHDPRWHIGVVGIVAAKLMREFGKPAIVIGEEGGVGKGSARSVDGFNVAEALNAVRDGLIAGGGHAGAAGLTIEPGAVGAFREAINRHAIKILGEKEPALRLALDMELTKEQVTEGLIEGLNRLEPYGIGNPKPAFATRQVPVRGVPKVVGTDHIKFQTQLGETPFDVMGFRMVARSGGEAGVVSLAGRRVDIAYQPCVNVFNGQRRLQLNLEDFRISN